MKIKINYSTKDLKNILDLYGIKYILNLDMSLETEEQKLFQYIKYLSIGVIYKDAPTILLIETKYSPIDPLQLKEWLESKNNEHVCEVV